MLGNSAKAVPSKDMSGCVGRGQGGAGVLPGETRWIVCWQMHLQNMLCEETSTISAPKDPDSWHPYSERQPTTEGPCSVHLSTPPHSYNNNKAEEEIIIRPRGGKPPLSEL